MARAAATAGASDVTRRVLVTGATGYVGSRLVSSLHRAGHEVVAVGRDLGRLEAIDWPADVRRLELDVTDAASCTQALASAGPVDVVYYLVHAIGDAGFAERDRESAATLGAAAFEAGVGRIVYLGGPVPDGEWLSEHLDSRAEVGEELQRSGVDVVWLRAGIVLGAGSTPYELIRQLVDRLPVVPLPTWMTGEVTPIAITDVVRYLVGSGDPARVPAGVYDLAGPERLRYSALVRRYARGAGLRRVFVRVRGVTPGMAAPVAARLTSVPTALVEDLVMSLSNSMRADDGPIRDLLLDGQALVGVDEALASARGRPENLAGVHATSDAVTLTADDAHWAR